LSCLGALAIQVAALGTEWAHDAVAEQDLVVRLLKVKAGRTACADTYAAIRAEYAAEGGLCHLQRLKAGAIGCFKDEVSLAILARVHVAEPADAEGREVDGDD
jgi:hypothetical protein